MSRLPRPHPALAAALLLLAPALAQSTSVDVINTRRELSGQIWGSGNWIAFTVDEDEKDLNGDRDMRDSILCLANIKTGAVLETGLAVSIALTDSDTDWPVAISGDLVAVQVSEADQGGRDLNGNGAAAEDALALYDASTRRTTMLGFAGRHPTFLGGRLYFNQPEGILRRDLNGDGDTRDLVVGSYDPASRSVENLGLEAGAGFAAAGDWIAAVSSETGQGARDLNDDRDTNDRVVQLYQVSKKKWVNTGLAAAEQLKIALTPKLLAIGTPESAQGGRDLNGDRDTNDIVCHIWELDAAEPFNTGQECGAGLAADGGLAAFITAEVAQGGDLNGDRDTRDEVAQAYVLGSRKVVSLRVDASGGLAVTAGRIAVSCSELDQNNTDLNRDRDTDDFVVLLYDPATNKITNTGWAADGDLVAGEGTLAWNVLEADQGDRDLNRDRDTEDPILCVMDVVRGGVAVTGACSGDYMAATAAGVGFATLEDDQGRDLNGDRDTDDEIVQIARRK